MASLTVLGGWDYLNSTSPQNQVLPSPPMYTSCLPNKPNSSQACIEAEVVCEETNVTQVSGSLGVKTASGRALAGKDGTIRVKKCLEHLLDLAFDFPVWQAGSSLTGPGAPPADYGLVNGSCSLSSDETGYACTLTLTRESLRFRN